MFKLYFETVFKKTKQKKKDPSDISKFVLGKIQFD